MTASKQFLVLSPNLGCPRLIYKDQLMTGRSGEGKSITVLIASNEWQDCSPELEVFRDQFLLRPSGARPGSHPLDLKLCPAGPPRELVDWDCPGEFDDADDTQWYLSRELHYGVLGSNTRYWALQLFVKDSDALNATMAGRRLMLFDLVWSLPGDRSTGTNFHSVQVMKGGNGPLRFLHTADLHLARRNDEILADVLQHKHERSSVEIGQSYVNFNEHFRQFIQYANTLADNDELDFVVVTGDLVDFANPGWVDKPCFAQSNWKTFMNILIGAENRPQSKGLKVAVFTSLGNHDWRLHPYNPCLKDGRLFGLHKGEIKDCVYKGFDSASLRPDDPRRREAERMNREICRYMNVKGIREKIKLFLAPYLLNTVVRWCQAALLPAGLAASGLGVWTSKKLLFGILALVAGLAWLGLRRLTRKAVDLLVDNPLHGGPSAVHFYLKHINPYFDYAFRCGPHWFIVMDTGADVFTGRLLDGKDRSQLRKMRWEDNIFGGSPDSRAFEADHTYCDWSQIVWLEKVLSAAGKQNPDGRKLVFVHAPPINTEKSNSYVADNLAESKRSYPKWVSEEECNLTYGTINHYLSQFFHLCLGRREGDPKSSNPQRKVDLVLSGHAHRNIEFRIDLEDPDKIRIYTEDYSGGLNKALGNAPGVGQATQWWKSHCPGSAIVQTGPCGPKGDEDTEPPYFRRVTINSAGEIQEFLPDHL